MNFDFMGLFVLFFSFFGAVDSSVDLGFESVLDVVDFGNDLIVFDVKRSGGFRGSSKSYRSSSKSFSKSSSKSYSKSSSSLGYAGYNRGYSKHDNELIDDDYDDFVGEYDSDSRYVNSLVVR